MSWRVPVLAFVALVLIGLYLLFARSPRPVAPLPAAPESPALRQQASRAFDQRPAVTLAPLQTSRSIQPAPSGAFEGRVVSALTGKGLPGAQLTFAQDDSTSSVTAGADGAFHFDARGRWLLAAATAAGHQPFAPEWGQSPVQLEARPGEVVRGITVALLPALELDGLVIDGEKKPVADAEITVLGGGTSALVPLTTRYRSSADGTFRFTAPEEAILEARHAGFATGRAQLDYSTRMSRKLVIQLKPASEPLLSIEGLVEDAAGAPAEGVAVSASRKDNFLDAGAIARTDAQGRFKLTELKSGLWSVVASKSGSAPASATVVAGVRDLRLRLTKGGQLSGRVTEKRSGAPVRLFTILVQTSVVQTLSFIEPDGRYRVDGLETGPTTVSVIAPGHAPLSNKRVTIPEPGAPPAQLDFELTGGGKLTGTVVERRTGTPLAGADVSVEGTSASQGVPIRNETVTDASGRFTLESLEETKLGIIASAQGHHGRILQVPPVADDQTAGPMTIELTPLDPGEEPQVELTGIGATLSKQGDALLIGLAAAGGGAAEAGLGPGDRILAADGVSFASTTLGEAIHLLRGPEGTSVSLSVIKAGSEQPVTIVVQRRLIRG